MRTVKTKLKIMCVYTVLASLSVFVGAVLSQECKKVPESKCVCTYTYGNQEYAFDLRSLNTPNPRFRVPGKNGQYQYYYQPCSPLVDKYCDGNAMVCQEEITAKTMYNAGDPTSVLFYGTPSQNNLYIQYSHKSSGVTRVSNIHMRCAAEPAKLEITNVSAGDQVTTYNFTLSTELACVPSSPAPDSHISTGSVLLILFFVLITVYFVAGMLYLKFGRGATGTEMVPNFEFWSSLPGYIKDGVTFTCRGCKTDTSYSQI